MRTFCLLAVVALIAWICWHSSFWVVFGWAYAVASITIIVVCFTHDRRISRRPVAEETTQLQAQFSEEG